ncbi:MAG TPA: Rieske 2Fe-2S domain-containing protein [Candidatus Limnocylindrales bacterium]|nr:Rieske 2Fe-2S domain-containing protein [Candidatus Limnocylindrales bacterium]
MDRWLARLIAAQGRWAKPLGDFNHRWLHALFHAMTPVRDLLNGRWLGHPLHSVLTDAPIGILFLVIVLDVLDLRAAADVALVVGILAMLASALAGAADYADTDGTPRERATVHSTLMVVALLGYVISLAIRAAGGGLGDGETDRTAAVWSSAIAFLVMAAGAYVGGEVVYSLGNMVSRHAFRGAGTKWIALEPAEKDEAGDIPEGRPVKAKLGINTLALVRQGETVLALHDTCAHAGGPLSEGTIEDGCLVCPWHFSKYRLTDGRARRGPTVYDQPAYEVRRTDAGGWEARRRAS